jgi:hypothetical protein
MCRFLYLDLLFFVQATKKSNKRKGVQTARDSILESMAAARVLARRGPVICKRCAKKFRQLIFSTDTTQLPNYHTNH